MYRLFSACLTIVIVLGLSACAAKLSSTWTINERTAVMVDDHEVGLVFPEPAAPSTWVTAPGPRTVAACGPSTVTHSQSRGSLRPGLGSYLRVDYWTTSGSSLLNGRFSAAMPTRANFDGILRRVPATGHLSAQEKVLLGTFLAVNRTYVSNEKPSGPERDSAAAVLDKHQATLWNAFVDNFCVEFIVSPTESDRSVLLFKSDTIGLCEALRKEVSASELDVFSRVFVHFDRNDTQSTVCKIPPFDGQGRTPGQSTLLGTLQDSAQNTFGNVAAGAGQAQGTTMFYDGGGLRIAAIGDITLQQPHFGVVGTETWTLADWESSGVCRGPLDEDLTVDRVILRGWARFAIRDVGNYRVVRRLTPTGLVVRVEPVGNGRVFRRTLSHADLAHLSPADLVGVAWRSEQRRRVAASCAKRP